MSKKDFTGWREVFSFTFAQTVKQKAYIAFFVIFSVIALLYSTVSSLISQYEERKETKTVITQAVVFDETGLDIDYTNAFTSKKYKNIEVISTPSKSFEEYEKQMEENPDESMLIKLTFDEEKEQYLALFVQGKRVNLSELQRLEFADEFLDYFKNARMDAFDIAYEQREFIQTEIDREVKVLSADGNVVEKAKESISYNDYFVTLALMMVCMMLINISGSQIAVAIVTEKSTRVLEYLVLNVRPLALVIGKLVATIVTSSLQMISVGFCYMASPIISNIVTPRLSKWLFGVEEASEAGSAVAEEALAASIQMIHSLRIEYFLLAFLFMILGIILYGIIAGLLGASVSKMDEMHEGMSLFQILLIVGCYADIMLCVLQLSGSANPMLSKVFSICPVTSPFLVPSYILLGKISWGTLLAGILVMVIVIVLLFMLTANVYEAMIFYNGKTLKIKDIIALASSKNKELVVGKEEVENEK